MAAVLHANSIQNSKSNMKPRNIAAPHQQALHQRGQILQQSPINKNEGNESGQPYIDYRWFKFKPLETISEMQFHNVRK